MQQTLRDSAALRWLVLILISSLLFSTYWFYDFYGGIKGLMEREMGISSEEYGRIMSSTTFANLFGMIILGGIILDRWGIRLAGLVFGTLSFLGAAISAAAVAGWFGDDKSTMLIWSIVGRVIFGIGMEVVCVMVTRTIVKWFMGYEMALAMALNIGFGRLGTAMGMAVAPDLAAGGSISPAFSFSAILIGISLVFFLIYIFFDIKIDRQRAASGIQAPRDVDEEKFRFADFKLLISNRSFIYITLLCMVFYSAVFPLLAYVPDLLVNKYGFSYEMGAQGEFLLFGSAILGTAFVFVVLLFFGLSFSMIPQSFKNNVHKLISFLVIALLFVGYVYVLRDLFSEWLINGPKTASLIPMGTILFTPIFGSIVDKRGKAATLMMIGSVLLMFAYLALSVFSNVYVGYLGLVSMGIAFSLVPAAMWPAVARIVAENRLGTAYGTMFTLQNWGMFIFFWGIGAMLDFVNRHRLSDIEAGLATYDYTIPVLIMALLGVISAWLAWKLKQADHKQGYGLENPNKI